jgi:hypothetical protein
MRDDAPNMYKPIQARALGPYTPRQKGVDATLDYTNGDDESSEPLENA